MTTIVIRALEGRYLKDTETFTQQDPYLTIQMLVGKKEIKKTRVHKNGGVNPVWDDTFVFDIPDHRGAWMSLVVMNECMIGDRQIGHVRINLEEVLGRHPTMDVPFEEWFHIHHEDEIVKSAGEVRLEIKWHNEVLRLQNAARLQQHQQMAQQPLLARQPVAVATAPALAPAFIATAYNSVGPQLVAMRQQQAMVQPQQVQLQPQTAVAMPQPLPAGQPFRPQPVFAPGPVPQAVQQVVQRPVMPANGFPAQPQPQVVVAQQPQMHQATPVQPQPVMAQPMILPHPQSCPQPVLQQGFVHMQQGLAPAAQASGPMQLLYQQQMARNGGMM